MKKFFKIIWDLLVEMAEYRARVVAKKGQPFYY